MRLRPATPGDVPEITRLHRRTALYAFAGIFPAEAPQPTVENLTARWSAWLGSDRRATQEGWVVEDDGHIVGAVLAGPDLDVPAAGHVSRMYVDPDWWGRGVGRRLHDEAVAHLRRSGYPRATLWVLEANTRARTWYERLGWEPTGRRKATYEAGGVDDVGYELTLTAWEDWQSEYRYGAFYIFPPAAVMEEVDDLRRRHDPKSHAICRAHISLSEPLPGPLTDLHRRELHHALARSDPFTIRYGPLRSFPPHPGVVYEIHPEARLRALREAIHSTSAFAGVDLSRHDLPPHMTVAEFISPSRTDELLQELADTVSSGSFVCETVELAVPDANFRFQRKLAIPLREVGRAHSEGDR